ncbi:unnamed protein product [Caenorhabditis angaria]|uniref:Uncharacterized protein n=1 Tax=Caenorhabditis angaria TaxID=860376 RepID=A0A9P1MT98_9PELO|nr:unnamed protein product [Caenorhabditis angaria]
MIRSRIPADETISSSSCDTSYEEMPRATAGSIFDGFRRKEKSKNTRNRKGNLATEGSARSRRTKREKRNAEAKEKEKDKTIAAAPAAQMHPAVQKWVERALQMGVPALRDEYRALAKYTMEGMTMEAFVANQPQNRNRYQDVPCQDAKRVALKSPPAACEYVHANYVGTPMSDKRFICAQGPLDNTIDEFWWLVWQEKAEQIIMLCNCIETGKFKCAQYWPLEAKEKREVGGGQMIVEKVDCKPMEREPTIMITNLKMTVGSETRTVRHMQWLDWPDRGVPPCRLTSMELLSSVRGSKVPIVVHCSAGIGRTGTIVAIEYILEKISAGSDCMAMGELMKELRNQRAYSIQNDLQYLYIHRVMLCYFLEKYKDKYAALLTEDNQNKYKKFVEEYNTAVGQ